MDAIKDGVVTRLYKNEKQAGQKYLLTEKGWKIYKEVPFRRHHPAYNNKTGEYMDTFRFLPWVGRLYERGLNGKKIMALGESHYCADEKDATPGLTQNVITWHTDETIEHEGWMNTYTKFIRALSGDETLSRGGCKAWWDRLVFYNYIKEPITGPRVAPTEEQFDKSYEAFVDVVEKYKPDVIIAWGYRLYDNLREELSAHGATKVSQEKIGEETAATYRIGANKSENIEDAAPERRVCNGLLARDNK